MTDLFLVTKDNFPFLFKAFEMISHDCGRQAGHINYGVPLIYLAEIPTIEASLEEISSKEDSLFELFCIGEENESMNIRKEYPRTDNLLQRFFEEFS